MLKEHTGGRLAGELDASFNGGSVGLTHTGEVTPLLYSLAATSDGGLLALSGANQGANVHVTRFDAQGQLEKAFAGTGHFRIDHRLAKYAEHIGVLDDGRFFVAGGHRLELFVFMYNGDGSVHSSYADDGIALVALNQVRDGEGAAFDGIQSADQAVQAGAKNGVVPALGSSIKALVVDDQVYLAFTGWWGGPNDLMSVLLRLDANGRIDRQFAGSGYFVVTLAGTAYQHNYLIDIAEHNQGVVLAVAEANPISAVKFVLRVTQDGVQDYSFAASSPCQGYVLVGPEALEFGQVLIVDSSGALKLAGFNLVDGAGTVGKVHAYLADGSVDTLFNEGHPLELEFEPGSGLIQHGVSIGSGDDYRLLLCARKNLIESYIGAIKLKADGERDRDFGQEGQAFYEIKTFNTSVPWVVDLFADGNIVLAALDTIYKVLNE